MPASSSSSSAAGGGPGGGGGGTSPSSPSSPSSSSSSSSLAFAGLASGLAAGFAGFAGFVSSLSSDAADAGFAGGGFSLKYIFETGYYWKRPLGEQFQANMKDLGIDVSIQELSPTTWVETLANKDQASEAYGVVWWPSLATPFDFLWSLLSTDAQGSAGYNFTYYSNPTFDKLIYAASAEPDEAKRTALYTKAQRLAVDDAPYLFLSDVDYLLPVSPKLKGFEFNGMYVNSVDPYKLHI